MHDLDFPLWLRALHFCNLLFLTLLIRSGLEILSAHPKLYWNDDCTPGTEWLNFGKGVPDDRRIAFTPTFRSAAVEAAAERPRFGMVAKLAAVLLFGVYLFLRVFALPRPAEAPKLLWTSRDEEVPLSSWLALPGRSNLGIGRHWHFLCDGGWLFVGTAYYTLLFATGEWRRLVPTSWSIVPGAWHAFLQYATLHLVETPGAYNSLQQIAYFVIVFVVAPLDVATGIAMSPSITGRFPRYLKLFGGRQAARSIHFLCMLAFTVFLVGHVTMIIAHGFGHELALIVLGQTSHQNAELAVLVGCSGLAGVFLIHLAATEVSLKHPRFVQNSIGVIIDGVRRALFGHSTSRQNYPVSDISSYFRVNKRPPAGEPDTALAAGGFGGYELEVNGLVARPLRLSLADLKQMPKRTQVTKHCCIQGWSALAEWGGVELKWVLERAGPLPDARYIAFFAFDRKSDHGPDAAGSEYFYGTIHMDLARDPQTILAYEMNGQPRNSTGSKASRFRSNSRSAEADWRAIPPAAQEEAGSIIRQWR